MTDREWENLLRELMADDPAGESAEAVEEP